MIAAVAFSLRLAGLELRAPGAIAAVASGLAPAHRQGLARDLRRCGVPAVLIALASWAWVPGFLAVTGAVVGLWGAWALCLADEVDA